MQLTTLTRYLCSLAVCVVLTASAQGVELVNNGSFETGTFAGWTTIGLESNLFQVTSFQGHDGTHSVVFAALDSDNTRITQNTPTAIGQQYVLDFWVNNGSDGNVGVGNDGLTVFWEGAEALDISPLPAQVNTWLNYTLYLTATSNGSQLEFQGFDVPLGIYLDDISLVAVPEPSTVVLLAVSAAGLTMRSGRRR